MFLGKGSYKLAKYTTEDDGSGEADEDDAVTEVDEDTQGERVEIVQFDRKLYSTTVDTASVGSLEPAYIRIRALSANHTYTTVESMQALENDAREAKMTVTLPS